MAVVGAVVSVHKVETVVEEQLLGAVCPVTVVAAVLHEIDFPLYGAAEHGCVGVLHRMGHARRCAVEHTINICVAEGGHLVEFLEELVASVGHGRRHTHHGDALSGVTEDFRTGDEQHEAVGIFGYGRDERLTVRYAETPSEVHAHIGQILHDDDVVLLGHACQDLQLGFGEVGPRRIVGVAVHYCCDASVGKEFLEGVLQSFTAAVVDVERPGLIAEEFHLIVLRGEAGIEKEYRILAGKTLTHKQEHGECALHRADGRHNATRRDIDIEESAEEFVAGLLEFGDAGDVGIILCATGIEGTFFSLDTYLRGGEPRITHLEMYDPFAQVLLEGACQRYYLAYCSRRDIHNIEPLHSLFKN